MFVYPIRSSRPAIDLADSWRKQSEKSCPGINWEVLKQQESEVLFEFKNAKCPDEAEFRGIGRTVAGQQNVFLVSYEVRGSDLSESAREEAIKLVSAARVISLIEATPVALPKTFTAIWYEPDLPGAMADFKLIGTTTGDLVVGTDTLFFTREKKELRISYRQIQSMNWKETGWQVLRGVSGWTIIQYAAEDGARKTAAFRDGCKAFCGSDQSQPIFAAIRYAMEASRLQQ